MEYVIVRDCVGCVYLKGEVSQKEHLIEKTKERI